MAFRWFRKNKQATKWLYIVVTIFVMVTFSITGAMVSQMGAESEPPAGNFVTPGGRTLSFTESELRATNTLFARVGGGRPTEQDIWHFLMLEAMADEAGIEVGDDLLNRYFKAQGVTRERFEQMVRLAKISPREFKEFNRRLLRTQLLLGLAAGAEQLPVPAAAIVEHFQKQHELFRLEYVSFPDDDFKGSLDASALSDAQLETWYLEEMPADVRTNEFSTPERFAVEAALVDPATADEAALAASLPEEQREVTDEQVQRHYEANRQRYARPAGDAPAPGGDAEGDSDEPDAPEAPEQPDAPDESAAGAGDEAAGEAEGDAEDEFLTLDEARPLVRRELLATRVITAARAEVMQRFEERRKQLAAAQEPTPPEAPEAPETPEEPQQEPPADPPSEEPAGSEPQPAEEAAPEPPSESEIFREVAEKFGLERIEAGEPAPLEAMKDLPRIGYDGFENTVRFLGEGQVLPRTPGVVSGLAYLVRLVERVAPEPLPFAEVRERVREEWLEQEGRKRAQEAAAAFAKSLEERARAKVQDEIAPLEAEARARALALADEQGVTDEAEREARVAEELKLLEPRIEAIAGAHEGEDFAAVAAERGLEVGSVDWFRKSYRSTYFWNDEPAGTEKFLKGHSPVFAAQVGAVLGPDRDDVNDQWLVAHVAGRQDPAPADMRPKDVSDARSALENEQRNALYAAGGTQSPFSFPSLAKQLALETVEPLEPPAPSGLPQG